MTLPSATIKEPVENLYMTTHISVENTGVFYSSNFTTDKSKDLSHLYLYISTKNPLNQSPNDIPFILYEIGKTNGLQVIKSDELLRDYPINMNSRDGFTLHY